jgi:subtilisin family serine protease
MLKRLVEEMGGVVIDPEEVAAKAAAAPKESTDTRRGYSRNDPVAARIVSRTRLNGDGSEKLTNHIEIDLSASFVVGQPVDDVAGHGTHTAGTVAAADNDVGVIGACPDCRLLIGKVLNDSSSGSVSNIIAGIESKTIIASCRASNRIGGSTLLA